MIPPSVLESVSFHMLFFFLFSIQMSGIPFEMFNTKFLTSFDSVHEKLLSLKKGKYLGCAVLWHSRDLIYHGKMWLWSRENIWCVSLCSYGWTQLLRQSKKLSSLVWGELHTSPLFIVPRGGTGCKGPLPERFEDSLTKLFAYSHIKEFYSMFFYLCRDRSTWS